MDFRFTNDKPIYLQIMDRIKLGILSGEFPKGSKLASVRDLAVSASVNPNTMQKALFELERLGFVRTERTAGRFITDDEQMIEAMKNERARDEITAFLQKMAALGFDSSHTIDLIQQTQHTEA